MRPPPLGKSTTCCRSSDHADFDQLLESIDRVDPEIVYCTHGPASFVNHVRAHGRRAVVLGEKEQLTLF